MYADEIYIAASAMCSEESETLRLLCAAAEQEFTKKLKSAVDIESIKTLFITACAMWAVSVYYASYGKEESVKSWSAGNVSVTNSEDAAHWLELRERAEILLAGYIDSGSGFEFKGVDG